MKIAALIKAGPHQFYFTNRIHQQVGIDLVVVEDKHLGQVSFFKQLQSKYVLGKYFDKHSEVLLRIKSKGEVGINERIFGEHWIGLNPQLEILFCRSINDPEVEHALRSRKTDVIVDHGTSIVKNHIIDSARLALNLHWGLSPYYRGTHCTEWALINWDPYNIGVTIHRLAKAIDGGDVVGQSRIDVESGDCIDAINMKLSRKGTDIMIAVLKHLKNSHDLDYKQQDFSQGFLTLNRQWTRTLRQHVQNMVDDGTLEKMLKTPARKERLPIVEFNDVILKT